MVRMEEILWKGVSFVWTEAYEAGFVELKQGMVRTEIIKFSDSTKKLNVHVENFN